jgi:hypothetical protein
VKREAVPQSGLDAGAFLFLLHHLDDGVEILVGLAQVAALRGHVPVVEGVKRHAEFFHEFEGHADPALGVGDGIGAVVPGPDGRSHPEGIGQRIAEGVPVHHREAEMLAHRFALDDFVGVVMFEGQRIAGLGTLVLDLTDFGEGSFHGDGVLFLDCLLVGRACYRTWRGGSSRIVLRRTQKAHFRF